MSAPASIPLPRLTAPTVQPYTPRAGENPALRWVVRATHPKLGPVEFPFASRATAERWKRCILVAGVCPPGGLVS